MRLDLVALAALLVSQPLAAQSDRTAKQISTVLDAVGDEATPRFRVWAGDVGRDAGRDQYRRLLTTATGSDRARLLWLIGQSSESLFDWDAAATAYTAAIAAATTPTERAAYQFGLARIQSVTDPAAADTTLAVISGEPRALAVIAQLRGRRALAANDPARAFALFGEALGYAGRYPDLDTADTIQSLLADMSLARTFAGNMESASAFAAASGLGVGPGRGYVPSNNDPAMCDPAHGIRPGDSMIFDVAVASGMPVRVTPVWWNRPGAAAAVTDLGRNLLNWRWKEPEQPSVLRRGIRVQVACTINGRFGFNGGVSDIPNPALAWLEAKGITPQLAGKMSDSPEAVLAEMVAALLDAEKRLGTSSLMLVPYLINIGSNDGVPAAVARGHLERAIALVESAGAPFDVVGSLKIALAYKLLEAAETGDASDIVDGFTAQVAALPPGERDGPMALIMRWLQAEKATQTGNNAVAEPILRQLLAVPATRLPTADPLRRAAIYSLARIADAAGRSAEADRLLASGGFAGDRCDRASEPVQAVGLSISADDYPKLLRKAEIGGYTRLERHVDANGRNDSVRIVYAQPPLLFDAPGIAAINQAHNTLPRRAGKAFPCYANLTPVLWQLQNWGAR